MPLPPPRSAEELHELVLMIGSAPSGERGWVEEAIAGLEGDDQVLELAHAGLDERPVHELGWTMTLLSITGQLRDVRSLDTLSNLMWAETRHLVTVDDHVDHGCVFDPSGIVQARAVEMFAWIAVTTRDDDVLKVVAEHPDRATRLAAADAFLYHQDDEEAALPKAREWARPEDLAAIGVPRFVRTSNADEFDQRLLATLEEIPLPGAADGRQDNADV